MQSQNIYGTIDPKVDVMDGVIFCPNCRRKIRGVRVGPETEIAGLRVRCNSCKFDFIVDIPSGQRPLSPRHL